MLEAFLYPYHETFLYYATDVPYQIHVLVKLVFDLLHDCKNKFSKLILRAVQQIEKELSSFYRPLL